jgi:hypothetical protein
LGLFVGKFEIEAAGIFFKAKKGSFNAGITGCQNEIESFLEKRFGIGYLGARYSYIRDINGAEEERRVYLSFKVSDF